MEESTRRRAKQGGRRLIEPTEPDVGVVPIALDRGVLPIAVNPVPGPTAPPTAVSRLREAGPAPGAATGAEPPELLTRNEVLLVGRVAAPAQERTLPSGDVIATWRLVVDRPPTRRPRPPSGRTATVDTLDCVAWAAGTRRTARGMAAGDLVAVQGALRRRFWRVGAAAVSRHEVEVATVKRLARAAVR